MVFLLHERFTEPGADCYPAPIRPPGNERDPTATINDYVYTQGREFFDAEKGGRSKTAIKKHS